MVDPAHDDWVTCPEGELGRLATRLRNRRRRRVVAQMTALVSLAAMLFGLWVFWPGAKSARDYDYGGISCARVLELADAYAAGKLAPELCRQVREHLAHCPHCAAKFREMGLTMGRRVPPEPEPSVVDERYALVWRR